MYHCNCLGITEDEWNKILVDGMVQDCNNNCGKCFKNAIVLKAIVCSACNKQTTAFIQNLCRSCWDKYGC